MLSRIQIGFLAIFANFLMAPILTFAQARPESLPPLDSLNFAAMQGLVEKLFNTMQEIHWTLEREEPLADSLQALASNQLTLAKMDSTLPKIYVDSLTKVFKNTSQNYKKRFDQVVKVGKLRQTLEVLPMDDSLSLRKNLPKAWKQVTQMYDEVYPAAPKEPKPKKEKKQKPSQMDEPAASQPAPSTQSTSQPINQSTSPKRFAAYNPATDVMLRPPNPPCTIASSSRDEFSGEISRQLAAAELFRYTNPALKTYLQGKTHVICEASLSSSGPNAALQLTFIINDPNARKAFGRLDKNSVATLKFLDGSTFELQNAFADEGTFNPENDGSIFHGQYPLNAEALKKIRRNGLDRIRILWSKGFDDYEVQQVDLLMRQAECLFK